MNKRRMRRIHVSEADYMKLIEIAAKSDFVGVSDGTGRDPVKNGIETMIHQAMPAIEAYVAKEMGWTEEES